MLDILKKFPGQVKEAVELTRNIKISGFDKILVCGMGGSGISGYILRDLIDMPVFISQSYEIPKFVDSKTLVFVISYSGDTEETISMYKKVIKKTKKIFVITSDGKLSKGKNVILVPEGLLPRMALAYLFFPMLVILKNSKVVRCDLEDVLKALKKVKISKAKKIAKKLYNKIPVIYAPSNYFGLILRWKQSLNEYSKQLAIANVYPEFFHNEVEADYNKFKVVLFVDKIDKKIREFKKMVKIHEVKLYGNSLIAKMFYGIYLGDFVSYYLARLNKKDPLKEENIDRLKCI